LESSLLIPIKLELRDPGADQAARHGMRVFITLEPALVSQTHQPVWLLSSTNIAAKNCRT
jgi:hypothetical protein